MNKLVYLFELDSVRNSKDEIKRGQQALFEEIVLNGNQVVLSFNQLTDSEAFLNLLTKEQTYQCLFELFKMGSIKISLFGDVRTPSQYVQNALTKCIDGKTTFLFSGIPILSSEKTLLENLERALKYNDIGLLKELRQEEQEAGNVAECERLTFLIRYIQLILLLSGEELAANAPKREEKHPYIWYMDLLLEKSEAYVEKGVTDKTYVASYKKAVKLLKDLRVRFNTQPLLEGINNRSEWVDEIVALGETEDVCIANAIIDLCYNYTIEESILGVSRHYISTEESSLLDDYVVRLENYLKEWKQGMHIFPTKDVKKELQPVDSGVAWKTAIRIVNNTRTQSLRSGKFSKDSLKILLYEYNYDKEKKAWKRKVGFGMVKHFMVTVAYMILFCISELLMGKVEGLVENIHILDGIWYDIIISIIIFGIFGSIFSEITKLPDLLESFKNMGKGFVDCVRLLRAKKGIAYRK